MPNAALDKFDPSEAPADFAVAVATVARSMGAAMRDLLAELPGGERGWTGSELASALDIDVNLAWKVLNVAKPGSPATVLERVPGGAAMQILTRAAKRTGIDAALISRLETAMDAYDALIDAHAGDRSGLEALLTHLDGAERANDIAARRAAFRANSTLLGVQAHAQLAAYIFWPERDVGGEQSTAMAILRGFAGFRRLRSDITWVLGRGRRTDHKGQPYGQVLPAPLDAEMAEQHQGVPLMRAFSSDVMPPVRRTIMPDGMAIDRLLPGPVGRQAALTFFFAETMRPAIARVQDRGQSPLRLVTSTHTPCEEFICDAIFHKDFPPLGEPECVTASELGGVSLGYCDPSERITLHLGARLEDHGMGIDALHVRDLPRYPALLQGVFTRIGMNPADFRAYRVKVEFPPVASAVMIERAMLPHV